MKLKTWLMPAITALGLGVLAVPGQAAPAGAVTAVGSDLRLAAGENAGVEQVHRRKYGYHRHYGYRPYRYHRYGYYRRPGFHFHFGPRRHYGYGYRRYHW